MLTSNSYQRLEPEDIQKLARIHSAAIDTRLSTQITVDADYVHYRSIKLLTHLSNHHLIRLQFWLTSG